MALDFPASPSVGQKYPAPPVVGVPVYTWDGEKWTTLGGAMGSTGASDDIPQPDTATGAAGSSTLWSRGDHVHPQDPLTRVPAANLIINEDFRVNQVGYVSAAVLGAGTYGHDQWKAGASGGDYSFTQLKSSTQISIASGKSLIQPIEDVNVAGGSYVLSWTGTAQARAGINTLTPSGSYAGSPLLIAGQTPGTAMSVEFNSGTLGTVKLESGAIATPFIMRPYDQELVACRRYWQKVSGSIQWRAAVGSEYAMYSIQLVPPMRATPTLAYTSTVVAQSNINALLLSYPDQYSVHVQVQAVAAGDAFDIGRIFTADARL